MGWWWTLRLGHFTDGKGTRYWLYRRVGPDRCEKSRFTFIRSPDPSAHSESLYRLRYPGPQVENVGSFITWSGCKKSGHPELSPLRVLIGQTPYNPPTKKPHTQPHTVAFCRACNTHRVTQKNGNFWNAWCQWKNAYVEEDAIYRT